VLPCFSPALALFGHEFTAPGSCFVVVVLSGLLARVDVGWRDKPGDAVFDVDFPQFFVDEVVVGCAEEDAVVGAGVSAL
jgi:hypothetical protein